MKRLFKLALASVTAIGLYGSPLMALANTESDELKDELVEHYWYDQNDDKVYTFDEEGQWNAYDASSQTMNMSVMETTKPSSEVLETTPESGSYDYEEGHVTIHEEKDEVMELDILSLADGREKIKDQKVYDAIQDYTEEYVLYDEENALNQSPCDFMVQMEEKEEVNSDTNTNSIEESGTSQSNTSSTEDTSDQQSSSEPTTDSNQSSQTTTTEEVTDNKISTSTLAEASPVYIAGNVYHVDAKCAGDDYKEVQLKQAVKDGYTPCEKEFSYDGYSFSTEAGEETKNTENNVNVNIEVINVQNNVLIVNEENTNDATVTSEEDLVNVNGKIVWKDNNNEYKVRPSKVTVILYRNGEQYKAIDVSGDASSDSWSFGFEKLAKKDESGNEYKYTIKEKSLAYYRGDLDGYVLTNTYVGQAPTTSGGSHTGTQTNTTLYAGVGVAAVAVVVILLVMNKKKQAK